MSFGLFELKIGITLTAVLGNVQPFWFTLFSVLVREAPTGQTDRLTVRQGV